MSCSIVASFALYVALPRLPSDDMSNVSPQHTTMYFGTDQPNLELSKCVSHMYLPHVVELSNLSRSLISMLWMGKSNFPLLVCIRFFGTLLFSGRKEKFFFFFAH